MTITETSRPANVGSTPIKVTPDGINTSQSSIEVAAAETNSPRPAKHDPASTEGTLDGTKTSQSSKEVPLPRDVSTTEANASRSTVERPIPNVQTLTGTTTSFSDHDRSDHHSCRVTEGSNFQVDHGMRTTHSRCVDLDDPFMKLAADVLDDLEKVRIANENRLRQLTRDEADSDGEERGFGLTEDHPDVARLAALVDALRQAEHNATLNLQRIVRRHPLGNWIKTTVGIGEKQGARLLAVIGDPYWNLLHDRPRLVSELWAYCGYHVKNFPVDQRFTDNQHGCVGGEQTSHPDQVSRDIHAGSVGVAPKRARGQRANWSAAAKMRTFLIAESCVKNRNSPFRPVYDQAREKYSEAVHQAPCVRCGPSGKPAQAGTPISAGHQHARALRAVSKEILKELWREGRRLHELGADQ